MAYCVAIKVNDGLVFAADTRTSAGVDDVRTYNKLHTFEFSGDRMLVLLSAGNLATTQTIYAHLQRDLDQPARWRGCLRASEYWQRIKGCSGFL